MTTAKKMTWILAICSLSFATFTLAQPKGPAACDQCPMKATSELSEVKGETTKDGATIRLRAKRVEDVTKVQEAAQQVAVALSGDCMMHASHHFSHGHKHGHGHNSPSPDAK